MSGATVSRVSLAVSASMPRIGGGPTVALDGITVGEWTLTRAAFTDRHQHAEINTVLEGELHVTCDGASHLLGPGETIVVPGGSKARYAAPVFARMSYVYGPGEQGIADTLYEEL